MADGIGGFPVRTMDDTLMSVLEVRMGNLLAARRDGWLTPEAEAEMTAISQTLTSPMFLRPPFCVLMAGLPGSGKTTLARVLTYRGFVRLCPDEEMYRRHGVYGVDFPRGTFPTLERPVLEDIAVELREHLTAGRDVVVVHGFWTPDDRTRWRTIATDASATRTMSTIPTRTTSQRATSSATAPDSYHPSRTNRTLPSTVIPRP